MAGIADPLFCLVLTGFLVFVFDFFVLFHTRCVRVYRSFWGVFVLLVLVLFIYVLRLI